MTNTLDIAWLGGLIEGEGCFSDNHGSSQIILSMTDRDTVERAATLFGGRVREQRRNDATHYKPAFRVNVCGARAIAWMMMLYQFLGQRRRQRVRQQIEKWKLSPRWSKAPNGQRSMAVCHPGEYRVGIVDGKPACNRCYLRAREARRAPRDRRRERAKREAH